MMAKRRGGNPQQLATALARMSPGRAPSLWAELRQQGGWRRQLQGEQTESGVAEGPGQALPPLLLVVGELDAKFVQLGRQAVEAVSSDDSGAGAAEGSDGKSAEAGTGSADSRAAALRVVPGAGHAVHVERPMELLTILDEFI